jgi:hypothetical protein
MTSFLPALCILLKVQGWIREATIPCTATGIIYIIFHELGELQTVKKP